MLSGILLLFSAVSCREGNGSKVTGRHAVVALMDSAELIMNDYPERACQLMDSIDSHSIRSRALQARYALLYTEARYKNYIDETNDSLIMIAVRYYSIGNDYLSRFRSYYSLGCIYSELGHYNEAIVALSEAERLTDYIEDNYLSGLLYTQFGKIYYDSFMFSRAKQYYEESVSCYESAGKERHKEYAKFYIALCELELENYDLSFNQFSDVLKWCEINSEEELYKKCLLDMMACSIYEGEKDIASSLFDTYQTKYDISHDNAYLLSLFSRYYLMLQNYDEALSFTHKAWNSNPDVNDSANILFVESRIYKALDDESSALDCYEKTISIQNRNLKPFLEQSVVGTQKDYYHTVSELESMKARRRASTIAVIVLFSILLIGIIIFYHLYNKQKLINQITDSLAIIRDLTDRDRINNVRINQLDYELKQISLTNDKSSKQVEDLKIKVRKLFSNQFTSLDKLYQDMLRIPEVQNVDRATRFLKRVNSYFTEITSKENQKKLDIIINETYDNLMVRLSDPIFEISESDFVIIRLSI